MVVAIITSFTSDFDSVTAFGDALSSVRDKSFNFTSSTSCGALASTALSWAGLAPKNAVIELTGLTDDGRKHDLLTDAETVHEVSSRTNTSLTGGVEDCVEDANGATTVDDMLVGSAFELADESLSLKPVSALALSVDWDFVEGTVVAISRGIHKLARFTSINTLVVPEELARRTSAGTVGVDLA